MPESVLTLGDNGVDVSLLQQDLMKQGFDCDGDLASDIFGPATNSAVKLFQASHIGPDGENLSVDGIVGQATWWALNHPSGLDQHQFITDVPPIQEASNSIAAVAVISASVELIKNVREVPDGSNRGPEIDLYTGMAGKSPSLLGPKWCAYFVSWNFAKAPGGSPFGKIGGAQSIVFWCKKHISSSVMTIGSFPKPGDIGIIAEDQEHGHAVHIVAVQGGTCWTIEGNCGNAVRSRKRLVSSFRYFVNFDAYAQAKGLM